MKLALVIYGDLEQTTGGYLYDQRLVTHLQREGHTVDILGLKDKGWRANLLHPENRWLKPQIKAGNYDAVVFDELCHPSLFRELPRLQQEVCCIGLIHHLKSSEPQSKLSQMAAGQIEKHFLRHQHAWIVNSLTTQRACIELSQRQRTCLVARPGTITQLDVIPVESSIEKYSPGTKPKVLFLGTITPRKGLHRLLKALQRVNEPVELTVVGSLHRAPEYVALCKAELPKLEHHTIRFLGEVSSEKVKEQLQESSLLALPSDYEGFGIAYLEGFSAGLPCIATTEGAPPEFVVHNHNGFLVKPDDISAITAHIQDIFRNPDKAQRMSQAARQTFEDMPDWDTSFAPVAEFIETAAQSYRTVLS